MAIIFRMFAQFSKLLFPSFYVIVQLSSCSFTFVFSFFQLPKSYSGDSRRKK